VPPTRSSTISSKTQARRVAEVRLVEAEGSVKVYCKVMIQEQAGQAYGLFAEDRAGGSDSPGEYTAINRDAATTKEQSTLWRTTRRDKSAERSILEAIESSVAGR